LPPPSLEKGKEKKNERLLKKQKKQSLIQIMFLLYFLGGDEKLPSMQFFVGRRAIIDRTKRVDPLKPLDESERKNINKHRGI